MDISGDFSSLGTRVVSGSKKITRVINYPRQPLSLVKKIEEIKQRLVEFWQCTNAAFE